MITPTTRLLPACLLLCAVVLFNAGPARADDFPASARPQYYPVDKNAVFVTQRFHRAHQGIDLAPIIKDTRIDVHATGDGKVILAEDCTQGWCKGYGNVVVIQHTNWSNRKTLYAHLERIDVKKMML